MATLEELAGLAALIMGSRYQGKQINRANRTKLEQMRQEQELQRQRFEAQKQAQDREQAWAEAKPFLDAFMGPNSADILSNMANQGNVGGFLDNAQSAFQRAGFPFDVSRYRVRAPRTEVDLSGVGRGSQAPPVGASPEGVMPTRQPMEASGTPVPRFNQLPPDMAGPPTPIANLPDERLRLLFGGLPQGMQGPPTPVSAMSPEPEPQATPAVEPFDEEEAYRERYQPGALTQAKIKGYASQAAERLFKQGLYKSQEEKNRALTEVALLMAEPSVRLKLAQIGLTEERAQTEALLRDPRLRTEIAKAENYANLPESREAQRGVQVRGQDITSETARRGQDITSETARRGQDMTAATAAAARALRGQGPDVPEGSKPFLARLAALSTATMRQASGAERPLRPHEIEGQAAQINAEHQRAFGIPLFGEGGVLSEANVTTDAGTPAPTAKPSAGGGLPAGITEAQVQAVAGLSSADYNAAFAAATPDEKRLLKAARGAAMRRKGR
jgi:hypothetical protein